MRKLIGTGVVGGVAALVIALAGNPGAVETIAKASSAHSAKAKMKPKKCKKGFVKKHGKCVKKSTKPTTTTTGSSTTTTGSMTTTSGSSTTSGTGTTSGTTTGTTTGTTVKKPTTAEVSEGKILYEKTCSGCHGMKGEGGALAPPYGSELPRSESIKGVVEQLENPNNTKGCKCMGNYNTKYTLAEKEEIGAYVTVELTKKEVIGGEGKG